MFSFVSSVQVTEKPPPRCRNVCGDTLIIHVAVALGLARLLFDLVFFLTLMLLSVCVGILFQNFMAFYLVKFLKIGYGLFVRSGAEFVSVCMCHSSPRLIKTSPGHVCASWYVFECISGMLTYPGFIVCDIIAIPSQGFKESIEDIAASGGEVYSDFIFIIHSSNQRSCSFGHHLRIWVQLQAFYCALIVKQDCFCSIKRAKSTSLILWTNWYSHLSASLIFLWSKYFWHIRKF